MDRSSYPRERLLQEVSFETIWVMALPPL
ncbi:unnamed protein product [Linum tenue]|uniref:Uncharacterized protein n=1 Tax=Linum tenue TaxID=586396 RepID=A0AAV0LB64_9ROSI|nr:unnamed protein product [Linum tenue]